MTAETRRHFVIILSAEPDGPASAEELEWEVEQMLLVARDLLDSSLRLDEVREVVDD